MSLIDRIIQAESGGNANARNSRSSAGGLSQFIDSTWLSMLAKHRPDIQGTREELLALKFDPGLSREMGDAYASDNSKVLSNSGLPVTPGTQYLAHFAGPQGAVGLLSADPSLPAGSVLGEAAVKANPFLARMTAGELAAWADRKVGGGAQASAPRQASQSAAPMPAPSSPPVDMQQAMAQAPFSLAPAAPSAPAVQSGGAATYMPDFVSDAPRLAPMPMFLPKRRPAPRGGFFNARG